MIVLMRIVLSTLIFDVCHSEGIQLRQYGSYFATKTAYSASPWHTQKQAAKSKTNPVPTRSMIEAAIKGEISADIGLNHFGEINLRHIDNSPNNPFEFYKKPNWPQWCTPLQVNALIRHGIRNAGKKEIDRFTEVFNRVSERLRHTDKQLHKSMESILKVIHGTEPKYLLNEGRVEQQLLAQRIFSRYSSLFKNHTSSDDILFVSSSSTRAAESCEEFMLEWQKQLHSIDFHPEIHTDDSVLRFFDFCNKYIREVEERKKAALKEYYKYVNTNFRQIAAKITKEMNLDEDSAILSKEVKPLYILAAIELATLGTTSLASLFDEESLRKMEYASDLKQYWKKSYGHQINYEQSCPLLVNMLKHIDDAVEGTSYKRGIFRFAHAETMLPLQALLGLFKDDTRLEADNYHLHHDRHFKTGIIAPFSGNLHLVLFECDTELAEKSGTSNGMKWERFMIQLLVNESPQKVPGWDHEFCPYSVFKDRCQAIVDSCDIESICNIQHKHEEL